MRDRLSQKPCTDFDLTGENAAELGRRFSQSLSLTCIPLDKTPGRQTVRVILNQDQHLDFTDLQGANIEEDLSQRDLTINAMGQSLSDFLSGQNNIIDPHNGQEDLTNRKIRSLPGPVIQSDPLRMLRAFRFAATLGFEIDAETLTRINLHQTKLKESAPERIWHELTLLLKVPNITALLKTMHNCGILGCLLPTSDIIRVFAQYERLESLLKEPAKAFPEFAHKWSTGPFLNLHYLLKLSVLLTAGDKNGMESSSLSKAPYPELFAQWNLRASNAEIKFIEQATKGALHLNEVFSYNKWKSSSETYEVVKTIQGELVASVLLFITTFSESSTLKDSAELNFCDHILNFYYHQFLPGMSARPLLNGEDIIQQFQLSPSPLFGKILTCVQKAQVLGNIATREEAINLAKNLIQPQTKESEA